MPTIPSVGNFNASGVDIYNAVRNAASPDYQNRVPVATKENFEETRASIFNYQVRANEFLSVLANLVIYQIITSKEYKNPLSILKKGDIAHGEGIEEIFVNIAKAAHYDPEVAETEVEKRVIPDVAAAFHRLNFKEFYKATVQDVDLELATTSYDGVRNIIDGIVGSLYNGAEVDEYICTKQQIAFAIEDRRMKMVNIPEVSAANADAIAIALKEWSNNMIFMRTDLNYAGVDAHTPKANQVILVTSKLDAIMDVKTMAAAFNMEYVDFLNNRILVDDFGVDSDGNKINVACAIVDKDFFQIYSKLRKMTERFNEQGLYWNYWYHVWNVFSISPFANAVAFTTDQVAVTSVTISPETKTAAPGETVQFTTTVVTTGYAPEDVTYSISGNDDEETTIDNNGKLVLGEDETDENEITVTVKSVFDSTKTDTAVVTIDVPSEG